MEEKILRAHLPAHLPLTLYDEIPSTQDAARALLEQSTGPHLVAAARQSAGRGRRGRSFFSPQGGLYMSLILPAPPGDSLHLVTPAAAVAVCRAIEQTCAISCGIKWVNDLEVAGKKVCGILTEWARGHVIIGIGVNLWADGPFPPHLPNAAALLAHPHPHLREHGSSLRELLAAAAVNALLPLIAALPHAPFLTEYRGRSTLLGRPVTVHSPQGDYPAAVLAIDDRARLVVQDSAGRTTALSSGEVSITAERSIG